MAHVVFVDSNASGMATIRRALELGHRVGFVRGVAPFYTDTPASRAILGEVHELVDIASTGDADEVTAALRTIAAQHPIDAVITQTEMRSIPTARAARAIGVRFTDPDAVTTARQKHRTRERVRAAGLASAQFGYADTVEEALRVAARIGYPVVVKPASGGDSLFSAIAADEPAARAACERLFEGRPQLPQTWQIGFAGGILIEEKLVGPLMSAEIGLRDEERFEIGLSGRFRWNEDEVVELGSFTPADVTPELGRQCYEYAFAACRAIGLDIGIFHVEMIVTARGPVLVEINPRLMGGGMPNVYRQATGHSVGDALLQLFLGQPLSDLPYHFSGCTGGRSVRVRDAATLPAHVDLSWIAKHPGVVWLDDYAYQPHQAVKAGTILAHFTMREPDLPAVIATTKQILHRAQRELGLPLMIDDLDYDARAPVAPR